MIPDLEKNLKKKYEELQLHLVGVGINPEHAHCAGCLKPTDQIPEVVKKLKRFSSHEINKKKKEFLKWGRGYSVLTVSERNLAGSIRHVGNQRRHHSASTL